MKAQPRRLLISLAVLAFWLGVWALASALVGKELLLPSPFQVLRRFLALSALPDFWLTVGSSILRVLTGILSALVLGVLTAILTESSAICRALISPLMSLVKSTPVASFIILALIWLGRGILPAFISALMVLPVVWANVSAGISARDPLLLEMAQVYGFSRFRVLRDITLPTVLPFFRSALSSALGLGWKAGIAAEVLTVPLPSIGKMIFESKLYLETTDLFAWTLAVILLSLLIERLLLKLVRGKNAKSGTGGGPAFEKGGAAHA